jgi:PfaB family protein
LLTVAGLTSLLKLILMLQQQQFVVTSGLTAQTCRRSEQGLIGFETLVHQSEPWLPSEQPRYAAVSAFGFGGTNAHLILSDNFSMPASSVAATAQVDLAVVGLGAHFGRCDGIAALEQLLFYGQDAFEHQPSEHSGSLLDEPVEPRNYVAAVDIDPLAFRIPPAELNHFNPQQLLMLKVAAAALTDAGISKDVAGPRNIAVLLVMDLDIASHLRRAKGELPYYLTRLLASVGLTPQDVPFAELVSSCGDALHSDIEANQVLSYIGNIMASRISSLWNLNGASFTLSGDGNGVHRAVDLARMMLSAGDCEAVLVGAVDLGCALEESALTARLEQQQQRLFSNDFGFFSGEGAGAIVLMPDEEARRQQVRRYATISPQQDLTAQMQVGLVQLSGVLNQQSLTAELPLFSALTTPAALLSLHSQLGYLRIAAPLAGLITTALALYHRYLPAQVQARPALQSALQVTLAEQKLFCPTVSYPWFCQSRQQRQALLSCATFTGQQDRLLLSEADWPATDPIWLQELALLPLAADDVTSLRLQVDQIINGELAADFAEFQARCWQQYLQGDTFALQAVLRAKDLSQLKREAQLLQMFLASPHSGDWKTPQGSYLAMSRSSGHLAFVYPGGFNCSPFLAHGLFRLFPHLLQQFEQEVEDTGLALAQPWLYPQSLVALNDRQLMKHEMAMLQDIPAMLTSGTSLALLYSRLYRDWFGIQPTVAFGYSLGESSMLFANQVWPAQGRSYAQLAASPLFDDQLTGSYKFVRQCWQLSDDIPAKKVWGCKVLMIAADQVRDALPQYSRLYITHINSPTEVIVAGDPSQLQQLVSQLGCPVLTPPTAHVLHAELIRPLQTELALLNSFPCQVPTGDIQLLSAGHYQVHQEFSEPLIAELNADSLCREVDFVRLIGQARSMDVATFLEVGPGGTCTRWIQNTLAGEPIHAMAVTVRGKSDVDALATVLAKMISLQLPLSRDKFAQLASPAQVGATLRIALKGNTRPPVFAPDWRAQVFEPTAINAEPVAAKSQTAAHYWAMAAKNQPDFEPIRQDEKILELYQGESGLRQVQHSEATVANAATPVLATSALVSQMLQQLSSTQQQYLQSQGQLQQLIFATLSAGHGQPKLPPHVLKDTIGQRSVVNLLAAEPSSVVKRDAVVLTQCQPLSELVMDEAQLRAFATGRIVDAFDQRYAAIDQFPVRVRLPDDPYFFVSRVTRMEAEFGMYQPCRLTTEYDIPADAWYLVDGVMPPGIAVEAGQSDLLLISYLGIDLENKGERRYRLLDGQLRFVADLPRAGQTLRFDIEITSFIRQGNILLFMFNYQGYVDGKIALVLERGCAGFFSPAQLAQGQGALLPAPMQQAKLVKPLFRSQRQSLTSEDIQALSRGELNQVFGDYCQKTAIAGVRLPTPMLLMIDEVTVLNRQLASGAWQIQAVKQLDAAAWYFSAHFIDDPVLPGSLVAEGATQLLKIYLMSVGLHQCFHAAEFQPIPDLLMDIKVRGQITPQIRQLRYEVEIFESGFLPRPYVIANVVVFDGQHPLVAIENLGLCLKEVAGTVAYPRYGESDYCSGRLLPDGTEPVLNEFHLAHAAKGCLKTAMGKEFAIYGPEHRAPYIPNGDFQFVDRALMLTGERGQYQSGSVMVTEYDAAADSWYFQQNSSPTTPNCVYLESALQASILLGYFLGATLAFPEQELAIRNLDGRALFLAEPDLRGRTIRHHETLLSTNQHNGSVLQNFSFVLECEGQRFYQGESLFGYFPSAALQNQQGLDKGRLVTFWYQQQTTGTEQAQHFDLTDGVSNALFHASADRPYYRLAQQQLNLLHQVQLYPTGGRFEKGYLHGYRAIRPTDWYFKCHFYRDPVMPGSLGLEAFIQGMQLFALVHQLGMTKFKSPRFGIATGVEHQWKYRGQLLMSDPDMHVEIHIKDIRETEHAIILIADCDLFKDHLRIYQVDNMSIAILEGVSLHEHHF